MATRAVEVAASTSSQAGVQGDIQRQSTEKGMVGAQTCMWQEVRRSNEGQLYDDLSIL